SHMENTDISRILEDDNETAALFFEESAL
ncbi:type II toxin-antitoxin system Phd/YefM family antitoxin, partial [Neisseria meningitidis]|nr:type II toxin-antitoxin system Phd/YefM family antitoxin [Neisseria meningitidis]